MAKAWTKDIVLDPGTFGGSTACHVLVDMMNQNIIPVYEKHRVLSFITSAIYSFNHVETIEDPGVREQAMYLMRDHYVERINKMTYPSKFVSFLRNVIYHHCRRALEGVV